MVECSWWRTCPWLDCAEEATKMEDVFDGAHDSGGLMVEFEGGKAVDMLGPGPNIGCPNV